MKSETIEKQAAKTGNEAKNRVVPIKPMTEEATMENESTQKEALKAGSIDKDINDRISDMKTILVSKEMAFTVEPFLLGVIDLLAECMFIGDRHEATKTAYCILSAAEDIYGELSEPGQYNREYHQEIADAFGEIVCNCDEHSHDYPIGSIRDRYASLFDGSQVKGVRR